MVVAKKTAGNTLPKTATPQVKYPKVDAKLFLGDKALTADDFKLMLGWEEEQEGGVQFGDDYLLLDLNKKKIRCRHNTKNRPLNEQWSRQLAQDMLNKRWADSRNGEDMTINGETFVISKYGEVLSGQHRAIACILAEQERTGKNKLHWEDKWNGPITLEALVVYGVSDSSQVTRTIDNVKPRTLSDVLFCDPANFGKVGANERQQLCKMVDNAIRFMWLRTGVGKGQNNPFSPKRTHSESLDFLSRHDKIKRAVKHVHTEAKTKVEDANGKQVSTLMKYFPPGYAAGMLYLMAAGESDVDDYLNADPAPNEKKVDFSLWDKATTFWTELAKNKPEITDALREAYAAYMNEATGTGSPSFHDRVVMMTRAWNLYKQGEDLTMETVQLQEDEDYWIKDGLREYKAPPTVGGIDLGQPDMEGEPAKEDKPAEDDSERGGDNPETEEEMEARKAAERERRIEQLKKRNEEIRNRKNKPAAEPEPEEEPSEGSDEEPNEDEQPEPEPEPAPAKPRKVSRK